MERPLPVALLTALLIVAATAPGLVAAGQHPAAEQTDALAGDVVVHAVIDRAADFAAVADAVAAHGTVLERSDETAVVVVRTADPAAVAAVDGVVAVERPVTIRVPTGAGTASTATTAGAGEPFWSRTIGAADARNAISADDSVDVAVVDTGINYTRPEFDDTVVWGAETVGPTTTYGLAAGAPDHPHGTVVAGLVAAEADAGTITGVAPGVDLYSIRVFENGTGRVRDVVEALYVAKRGPDRVRGTADDAEIITHSGGSNWANEMYLRTVEDLRTDTILVAAAGNSGDGDPTTDEVVYPARFDGVIAVGATDRRNETATFSSSGPAVDIAAPGVDVRSVNPARRYSGTSLATPQVAGATALLVARHGPMSTDTARAYLTDTTVDIDAPGRDNESGAGLLQVDSALGATSAGTSQVTLGVNAPTAATTPGGNATLTFEITNQGTTRANSLGFQLTSLPANWSIANQSATGATYFDGQQAWAWTSPLGAGDSRNVTVTLAVPAYASGGSYVVDAEASTANTSTTTVANVTVVSNSPSPVGVQATNATAVPGGETNLTVVITNRGNTVLNGIGLQASSLPANWSVVGQTSTGQYLPDRTTWFWLNPVSVGDNRTVEATVSVPANASTGRYVVGWNAGTSGSENQTVSYVNVTAASGNLTTRFDADGDGSIGFNDVLAAIDAFNKGQTVGGDAVTFRDIIDVIAEFNS